MLRAERRIESLERALGVAGPQGVFPVPANVHTENEELEASAQILEASFDEYLDEKSVTEREHGSRDLEGTLRYRGEGRGGRERSDRRRLRGQCAQKRAQRRL